MLLGAVTVPAMAVSVDQLTDVKKTDWFYSAVQYLAEKDYMIGVTDDLFAPSREVSRAMFVVILHRLDGEISTGASNFVDVPANAWCARAVNWAAKNGIVNGINEKEFAPNDPVTREQMCAMMARFLNYRAKKDNKTYPTSVPEKTFLDAASIGTFAKEAVKQCQMWGLVYGEKDGKFSPKDNSTRAEVAAVIQRLDVLLSSGKGQGGGSIGGGSIGGGSIGGGGLTTNTASYTIKAILDVPSSLSSTDPELAATYNNVTVRGTTVTGDKTFGQVAKDLVNGENATVLKKAITEALNKVKGKTVSQTVNGQKVTVSITNGGVISAFASVKVTDIANNTLASQAQLEALIGKLQNGGEMSFTKDELQAMDDLLVKIDQVGTMELNEIQNKIDQVVAQKPELEQVVSGMTPDAVKRAAETYKGQVENILTDIDVSRDKISDLSSNYTSKPVKKDPVLMNVQMDLGTYYDQAAGKFTSSKTAALNRLESELGLTFTADQQTKAGAVYDLNHPANYVTKNSDKTLTLMTADQYLPLIQANVAKTADFYASLNEDAAFYQSLLKRVENKYQNGYGVSYTGSVTDAAALMGDKDGILVDESKNFRNSMTFSVTVDADEDTYFAWRDLITGKFSQAGSILPGEMPGALAGLVGNYTITLNVTKQ